MEIDYDKLKEQSYQAFLTAFQSTGDAYKKLSWFSFNRIEEVKKARETKPINRRPLR